VVAIAVKSTPQKEAAVCGKVLAFPAEIVCYLSCDSCNYEVTSRLKLKYQRHLHEQTVSSYPTPTSNSVENGRRTVLTDVLVQQGIRFRRMDHSAKL
jgi:hypothetical protein